jgi:hypothetical protein
MNSWSILVRQASAHAIVPLTTISIFPRQTP